MYYLLYAVLTFEEATEPSLRKTTELIKIIHRFLQVKMCWIYSYLCK